MIADNKEFVDLMWQLQTNAPTSKAVLSPTFEQIYEVDLNTRKIIVPKYLSVKDDHQAETIYFKFDRFYENVDLTTVGCFIKYINAENESFIYPVPFYDIYNAADENKIIIPWCIQGSATKKAGTIKFSICFFKVNEEHNLSYSLNTLVAESQILQGQNENTYEFSQSDIALDDNLLELIQELTLAKQNGTLALYWLDV